jgi:hypothetical protein
MTTQTNARGRSLLSHYGSAIAHYRGKGALSLKSGGTAQCTFEAGQLSSGEVLLCCQLRQLVPCWPRMLVEKFKGTTADGGAIRANEGIRELNYLPPIRMGRCGVWAAFQVNCMEVVKQAARRPASARFGLTNLVFTGTRWYSSDNRRVLELPITLGSPHRPVDLCLRPLPDYDARSHRLRTLKGIDVTCEVEAAIPQDAGVDRLRQLADELCDLLSVARGTRIQWVYLDQYAAGGELLRRTHCSRITKRYCALPLIDPASAAETANFVQRTHPAYLARRKPYKLDSGLINAYLDAKAEDDFLESRGTKLAVATEALKTLFLQDTGCTIQDWILPNHQFRRLRRDIANAIEAVLQPAGIDGTKRAAICNKGKIAGLNRSSFESVLTELCAHVGLKVPKSDLRAFIKGRNSLIHTGRFSSTLSRAGQGRTPRATDPAWAEYLFLLNFLDKLLLKLLAYTGPYIDWAKPGNPVRTDLA